MDKDNNFYPHVFTWEQFQRALLYTKKYYGMVMCTPKFGLINNSDSMSSVLYRAHVV